MKFKVWIYILKRQCFSWVNVLDTNKISILITRWHAYLQKQCEMFNALYKSNANNRSHILRPKLIYFCWKLKLKLHNIPCFKSVTACVFKIFILLPHKFCFSILSIEVHLSTSTFQPVRSVPLLLPENLFSGTMMEWWFIQQCEIAAGIEFVLQLMPRVLCKLILLFSCFDPCSMMSYWKSGFWKSV